VSGYPLAIHTARWGACHRGSGAIQQHADRYRRELDRRVAGAYGANATALYPGECRSQRTIPAYLVGWHWHRECHGNVNRWVSRQDHVSADLAWGGKSNRLCALSRRRHHRARQRGAPGATLDSSGERARIGDSAPTWFQVTAACPAPIPMWETFRRTRRPRATAHFAPPRQ